MQIAKAIVSLNRGHNLPIEGLTPAEVQFLLYEHSDNVGGASVTDLVITGEEAMDKVGEDKEGKPILKARTDQVEKARLASRYVARDKQGKLEIENVFPGLNPRLPAKFEDIEFEGLFPFKEGGAGVTLTKAPLREDGPTFEEFVGKGYAPVGYPPAGYAERPSAGLTEYKAMAAKAASDAWGVKVKADSDAAKKAADEAKKPATK